MFEKPVPVQKRVETDLAVESLRDWFLEVAGEGNVCLDAGIRVKRLNLT